MNIMEEIRTQKEILANDINSTQFTSYIFYS